MTVSPFVRAMLAALTGAAVSAHSLAAQDSSFAAMQQRGKVAMGVDQYTSVHHFDDLSDGGRIRLERDKDDAVGARAIQAHLRDIAKAFSTGDFTTPAFVHMQHVPGTAEMAKRRAAIRYKFQPLPRGGELHITTGDTTARRAIHEFLAFQRGEHHADGHDMRGASGHVTKP
jgi:hypothetical protein